MTENEGSRVNCKYCNYVQIVCVLLYTCEQLGVGTDTTIFHIYIYNHRYENVILLCPYVHARGGLYHSSIMETYVPVHIAVKHLL